MSSDQTPSGTFSDPPALTLWNRVREREEWTDEERQHILDDLFPEDHNVVHYVKRFAALLVLSTTIAAFGLVANSAAVVIGAMLVAPLMTPMLALAASLVYGEMRRFMGSVALIVVGTGAAIVVGWLVAFFASGSLTATALDSEILARTSPSLLDLGIAIAAGLAGGYVLTHKGSGSSLPGVAIAVALVPPLATVGVTLNLGATELASGALLLYTTNLIAIVLSASVVMMASGFVPDHVRSIAKGRFGVRLLPWAVALLAVAIPLAIHTQAVIREEAFTRVVTQSVAEWDPRAALLDVSTELSTGRSTVEVTVATTIDSKRPAWELAKLIADKEGVDVDVEVTFQTAESDASSTS
ncbi:MAG: TIGR00341 family protein [Proteobacteria bacterium]|nr:TIGR00341 family protein [Pseudomonadota bacterium]